MTDQEKQMETLYPFFEDTMFREEDGTRKPWYTPDAIEWIKNNIVFEKKSLKSIPVKHTVLEFGGGHSTLWWRKRAIIVDTVEFNPECCSILGIEQDTPKGFLKKYGNSSRKYDVVIVDSEAETPRQDYIKKAFGLCDKYFIVDNWQQPMVCVYDQKIVDWLYANTKEQHIFSYPHSGWQTAIFVK